MSSTCGIPTLRSHVISDRSINNKKKKDCSALSPLIRQDYRLSRLDSSQMAGEEVKSDVTREIDFGRKISTRAIIAPADMIDLFISRRR